MEDEKKKRPTDEHTPIIDGDARPDIDVDPDLSKVKKREQNVTPERGRDVNTLENYKDEK